MSFNFFLVFSAALGGVSVHYRDLHPGSCTARPEGKPGDDSGLQAVHSSETHTHTAALSEVFLCAV